MASGSLVNGAEWYDTEGNRINCHGGNIIRTDSHSITGMGSTGPDLMRIIRRESRVIRPPILLTGRTRASHSRWSTIPPAQCRKDVLSSALR